MYVTIEPIMGMAVGAQYLSTYDDDLPDELKVRGLYIDLFIISISIEFPYLKD